MSAEGGRDAVVWVRSHHPDGVAVEVDGTVMLRLDRLLSPERYAAVRRRADAEGVPVYVHVRRALGLDDDGAVP